MRSVAGALERAAARARAAGATALPAIAVGETTFIGLDAIERAVAAVNGS
jgi:hypothetical protein